MVLAIDVFYTETYAKAVGILFDWEDDVPKNIIMENISEVEDYVPGQFYKRELPCIMKIIEKVELYMLEAIVVDGYVYVNNEKDSGLGYYVWEALCCKIPIIGVAKNSFFGNAETVVELRRGDSNKPLYISSVGIELDRAVELIKNMKGEFRVPTLLKKLDGITKDF